MRSASSDVSADRDDVAAAVAVTAHGTDRLADLEVRVRLDDALGREHGVEAPMRVTRPVGSGPGSAVKKRIASGCVKRGSATSSGHVLAERLPERDLDEVDAHGMADEVGHLASGDARGDLDDGDAAVGRGDELRERDRVAEAERAHRLDRDLLGEASCVGGIDGGYTWIQPTPKPMPGGRRRSESVIERGLAAAGDHDAVQLDAVDELLEERLVGRRLVDRLGEVALELLAALDAEDGALAARVDRLEDRRERDRVECGVDVRIRAKARVRRLWEPARTERVAHRALVRQEVRRLRSDARQAELLGDGGDDGHGAIGRHREHAVDADRAARPRPPRRRP